MTASLLNLLGQIHPVLRNLAKLPLLVFVLVSLFTELFILGYLIKGGQVGRQLWPAVRAAVLPFCAVLCGRNVGRKRYPATVSPVVHGAEHMNDKWDW